MESELESEMERECRLVELLNSCNNKIIYLSEYLTQGTLANDFFFNLFKSII
jgi:hypothetical protein